jgi:hypothetical protein
MMELICVGLRSVMMVGSGVGGMKLFDGQRWKCSRQGGMEFKHVDSLWRLLRTSFPHIGRRREVNTNER